MPIVGNVCCHQLDPLPFTKGRIAETNVQVLRETGCNGVIVKCDLVPPWCFTGSRKRIILMDRSVIEVPVAKVRVDTSVFCGEVYALCVQNPVCDVIIGNIPGVHPNILGDTTNEELHCSASNDKALPPMNKPTACAVQIMGQREQADRPTKPLMTTDGCRTSECCHLRECYKSEVARLGALLAQKDQLSIDLKVTWNQLTEENEAIKCRLEELKVEQKEQVLNMRREIAEKNELLDERMTQMENATQRLNNADGELKAKDVDITQKGRVIDEMKQEMRKHVQDLKSNANEIHQLTGSLGNLQTELQQRATQVKQRAMDFVDYKTDTEQRMGYMESTTCKSHCENEQKAIQITELDAGRHHLEVDLEGCRTQLIHLDHTCCDSEMNDSLDTCFNECKSLMCCAPDFQKEFVLPTDASDTGLNDVLLQTHEDPLFPGTVVSKQLSGATKSYATVKRACLAIF